MLNLNWLKPLQTNASDSANLDYQAHKGIIIMLQFSISLLILINSWPYFIHYTSKPKKWEARQKKSYLGEFES